DVLRRRLAERYSQARIPASQVRGSTERDGDQQERDAREPDEPAMEYRRLGAGESGDLASDPRADNAGEERPDHREQRAEQGQVAVTVDRLWRAGLVRPERDPDETDDDGGG